MRKADNPPQSCAFVTKFGNLKFLEPSGPVTGLLYMFTFILMLTLNCIWHYVNDDMEEISEKSEVVYFKLHSKQWCEEVVATTKTRQSETFLTKTQIRSCLMCYRCTN